MDKFSLQHTVLYAKNWYERYDETNGLRKNIWEDLMLALELDGYQGTFIGDNEAQIKHRVAYLIVGQFQRLPNKGHANTLQAFYEGIKPFNCWKYGYYTKDYVFMQTQAQIDAAPVYDYDEAVVRYCLSYFVSLSRDEWEPCAPNYTKGLAKPKRISKKKIKDQFSSLKN